MKTPIETTTPAGGSLQAAVRRRPSQWRYVEIGDTIKAGDQRYSLYHQDWIPADDIAGHVVFRKRDVRRLKPPNAKVSAPAEPSTGPKADSDATASGKSRHW